MGVGALHHYLRELSGDEIVAAFDVHQTIDVRGVGAASGDGVAVLQRVDQHPHRTPDFLRQSRRADFGLGLHEARIALFLDLFGNSIGKRVGRGAFDWRILETAGAIDPCRFEKIEQGLEVGFGLTWKAHDKV